MHVVEEFLLVGQRLQVFEFCLQLGFHFGLVFGHDVGVLLSQTLDVGLCHFAERFAVDGLQQLVLG